VAGQGRQSDERGSTHQRLPQRRTQRHPRNQPGCTLQPGTRKRGSTYTWYFDVPDPVTGKRRPYSKGGFRTKKECQQALNEALAALRTGIFVEPSNQPSLGSWWGSGCPPCARRGSGPPPGSATRGTSSDTSSPPSATSRSNGSPRHSSPPSIEDCSRPGIGREAAALPEDRPEHPWRPTRRAPGRGSLGACRPQRRGSGRSTEEHGAGDARLEPGAAPRLPRPCPNRPAVRPLGCCWRPPACARERWPDFAGPTSTWTRAACRPAALGWSSTTRSWSLSRRRPKVGARSPSVRPPGRSP
jgi:hypothetical protein